MSACPGTDLLVGGLEAVSERNPQAHKPTNIF